jgi:hypothetical protein
MRPKGSATELEARRRRAAECFQAPGVSSHGGRPLRGGHKQRQALETRLVRGLS